MAAIKNAQENSATTIRGSRRIYSNRDGELIARNLHKAGRKLEELRRKIARLKHRGGNGLRPGTGSAKRIRELFRLRDKYIEIRRNLIRKLGERQRNETGELWTRVVAVRVPATAEEQQSNQAKEHKPPRETGNEAQRVADALFPPTSSPQQEAASWLGNTQANLQHKRDQPEYEPTCVTEREIVRGQKMIKGKKYSGPDGIKFQSFNESFEFLQHTLYKIARMSFALNHIPRHCRATQGIAIPKKQAGKFRVVHIATPMAAFLEVRALNRLEHALDKEGLRDPNQFGFSKARSRHGLVAKPLESMIKHRVNLKRLNSERGHSWNKLAIENQTTIIGLDIEGAFDNVDQGVMIREMHLELNEYPVRHWISGFISNKWISVKLGQQRSTAGQVRKGVPQGSALGPVLWNYTISSVSREITSDKSSQTILV